MSEFTLSDNGRDDHFDVRDVIARVEGLESDRDDLDSALTDARQALHAHRRTGMGDLASLRRDRRRTKAALRAFKACEGVEMATLTEFLASVCGYGGDHKWRGDWYPVTFIRDSNWDDYAREYAEEVGAVNANASWPHTCIDWDKAASELQQDYSSTDLDGETYWYR